MKATSFAVVEHAQNDTPMVTRAPGGQIRCEENAMFCRSFRLYDEIAAWRRRP